MVLSDQDRAYLKQAYQMAVDSRRPPERVGVPVEPTWSAVLASSEGVVDSAVILPGGAEDPVQMIVRNGKSFAADKCTLYITLEPSNSFLRLPPATESIRALGVKRVVVGAENPVLRSRGQGIATLRQFGFEVILADGEEARLCQVFYEDYAKAMNRSLPLFKLVWRLAMQDTGLDVQGDGKSVASLRYDALLVFGPRAKKVRPRSGAWLFVIDPECEIANTHDFAAERVVVVQPTGQDQVREGFLTVPRRDLFLDLASILRKMRELGFLTVVSEGNDTLFRHAISSDLVDSVVSMVQSEAGPAVAMSKLSQLTLRGDGWPGEFRLLSPRLLEAVDKDFTVESEIRLHH